MHQSNTEKRWSKVLPSDAPQVWYGYRRTRNWKYMATQVYQRQWAGRSSTSWPKHGPGMQNTFIEHAWSTKISCRRHRCALSDFGFYFFIMNHPENITFILVVYYFAKKKVRKTKRNSDFGFICTLFWYICTLFWASTCVLNFRRQKQTPCKSKHKFQNSEKTTELANSQAI